MKITSAILTSAQLNFSNSTIEFDHIYIDSRSLQNGNATLFFCLKGQNNDAHIYIESLIEKGVQHFVVEYIPENVAGKANFCLVENTTDALQNLAKSYKNPDKIRAKSCKTLGRQRVTPLSRVIMQAIRRDSRF